MRDFNLLRTNDPELYEAVMAETARQRNKIELIASENFVSEVVRVVPFASITTSETKFSEAISSILFLWRAVSAITAS